MRDLNQLSINQLTTRDQWSLPEAVDGYARAGVGAMAVWWEKLREVGTERAARAIRDAGMAVTGYCAGGMLTARDDVHWRQRLDDNRRMVDEAAAIGSSCLVALGGGLDPGDRDIEGARQRALDGFAELLPCVRDAGIVLALEPLHPMVCATRSVLCTHPPGERLVRCARRRTGCRWWGRYRGRYLQRVVGPGARFPDRTRRRTHRRLPRLRLAARYERSALRSGDAGRRGDRFPPARRSRRRSRLPRPSRGRSPLEPLVAREPRDGCDDGARTLPQRDVAGYALRVALACGRSPHRARSRPVTFTDSRLRTRPMPADPRPRFANR